MVISHFPDRVDFFQDLNNRVVNIVPVARLEMITRWCDDTTQTVGIYPESIRGRLRDALALAGVQRMVPLTGNDAALVHDTLFTLPPALPHDGIEPMRRSMRWVIDQQEAPECRPAAVAAE